ncbi:unnamed protein product [Choristocarpus tenellus]
MRCNREQDNMIRFTLLCVCSAVTLSSTAAFVPCLLGGSTWAGFQEEARQGMGLRCSTGEGLSSHRDSPIQAKGTGDQDWDRMTSDSSSSRTKFLQGFLVAGSAALSWPMAALSEPALEMFKKNEICVERNLLGACSKYGTSDEKEVPDAVKVLAVQGEPESDLVSTLKQRTIENKKKNDEEVEVKTAINGQAGTFGPFTKYTQVKHRSTGEWEMVLIRDVEELKKEGKVNDLNEYLD